jgi:hypothetical protein
MRASTATLLRRCVAGLAASATVVSTVAGAAAPASAAIRGFATASGGPVGVLPAGLQVYVRHSGADPDALYAQTRAGVAQLRDAGLPVRFRGWGAPTDFSRGVVAVRAVSCASSGALGYAYPRTLFTGWAEVRLSAVVKICRAAFRNTAVLRATMLGELGRVVGLGTFNDTYDGGKQLLNATVQPQFGRYQAGDVNGLHYLAAITRQVAPTLEPTAGGLTATPLPNGSIRLTGWALNGAENDNPADVAIRRDGSLLGATQARISSDAGRVRAASKHMTTANDFALLDAHPGAAEHTYCARLRDAGSLTFKIASLGCVSVTADELTATLDESSGPDADGLIVMRGTAVLTGAPDIPLSVTVLAGGLVRGRAAVDLATHSFAASVAPLHGSYNYCVTVTGGGQSASAGCAVVATG